MSEFKLYFGRAIPNKKYLVTPASFAEFRKTTINPQLKGYTITSGEGVWEGQKEPSYILTYIGEPTERPQLEDIGKAYARRYHQQAVFMTESPLQSAELLAA